MNRIKMLTEGLWLFPRNPAMVSKLEKLVKNPIMVDTPRFRELQKLIGSDDLYSMLEDVAKGDDIRYIIASEISRILSEYKAIDPEIASRLTVVVNKINTIERMKDTARQIAYVRKQWNDGNYLRAAGGNEEAAKRMALDSLSNRIGQREAEESIDLIFESNSALVANKLFETFMRNK